MSVTVTERAASDYDVVGIRRCPDVYATLTFVYYCCAYLSLATEKNVKESTNRHPIVPKW